MATTVTSPGQNQGDRKARLHQIAAEWAINSPPPGPPLTRLLKKNASTPSAQENAQAEDLLNRHRLNASQNQSSQSGFKRAFSTSKKKGWEPKEVFDVLTAHVENAGSPEVAEALITKLVSSGGDLNAPASKSKPNILARRKSTELLPRGRILQKAIENQQADMVAVLLPYADPLTIDFTLPIAIRQCNIPVTELLLRHGANASQSPDCHAAFQNLCSSGGQPELVGLILRSDGRPPPDTVSQAMIEAGRKGDLETVLQLSRSTADGSYLNAAALKDSIVQSRADIALAILTGNKPPTGAGLNEAFVQLFSHPSITPNEKMIFAEILLCAGANGDSVSMALVTACHAEFFEMVELLVHHGASIEFQNAAALRNAVSNGKTSLVQMLLGGRSALNPSYASDCAKLIPKIIGPAERYIVLELLLRRGASGAPLHDALIDAVEAGDIESVRLLVTPMFATRHPSQSPDLAREPGGPMYDRHEVASVDFKNGLALEMAVAGGNLPIAKLLLSSKPSVAASAQAFLQVQKLTPADRYDMTEAFLRAGLSGPSVSTALQQAVDEQRPRRDDRLIGLLLRHNADVNFNDGASILAAVAHQDLRLLEALLKGRPTPQIVSLAMPKTMLASDQAAKMEMAQMLLAAGATGQYVAEALVSTIQARPTDMNLVDLLVKQGRADVNFDSGAIFLHAVRHPMLQPLEALVRFGSPTAATLEEGLRTLCKSPTSENKPAKMDLLLQRIKRREALNDALVTETEVVVKTPPRQRVLTTLKSLLNSGGDVNAHNAAAICHAIAGIDGQIVDMYIAMHPAPMSLAYALPHALHIADPMDRLAFAKKLLRAGAPAKEANRALMYAIDTFVDDLPLIRLLASCAEINEGDALMLAIKKESPDVVEVLLASHRKKPTVATLNAAFEDAYKVQDKEKRTNLSGQLLKAGASGAVVSNALVAAAADADTAFGKVLMDNGATVDHNGGQAVVEACRAGAVDVVRMLLSTNAAVKEETLAKGFQAATEIGDLKERAKVFRLLLDRGATGVEVDEQLVSAARFGDDGMDLVRLLLEYGASPDFNTGEAVWTATRSAFLGSLEMMLGVVDVGGRRKKPSQATMARALKASWRLSAGPRYQVIQWLFQAGLPVTEDVHTALNKAVTEDDADMRLVQLLLDNGASPLANGCQALLDAAQHLLVPTLDIFLRSDIPQKDVSWTFAQTFTPERSGIWLSESGLGVARALLDKGARGDGPSAALASVIDACGSERDSVARQFLELLTHSHADVDYDHGRALQMAAKRADSDIVSHLLSLKPSSVSVTMAFPYIFDATLSEDTALSLITLFTEYTHGEHSLDVMSHNPECRPILFQAVSQYPRSLKILLALLDGGYYHDQMTTERVSDEMSEDEPVSLLFWSLLQPQKKVSSNLINLLIERGAKVNFESRLSKTTPLMLAVQQHRPDLVRSLLLAGAEVDVADITGNTPLTMATRIGGDLGTTMMSSILAADPSKNDGSLHNAARELNLDALKVLIEFGHDVDFPSPLHDGRSALGEVCLHAAGTGEITAAQEKTMEKVMAYLTEQGTDLGLLANGKSVLLLALTSSNPLPTTRALLKVGMWKSINQPFNNYDDGTYTFSPTMYTKYVLPASDAKEQLLALLKANRAQDVYYANEGPQPDGALGLPDELLAAQRLRKARLERIQSEAEDHTRALAQTKELARIQDQIYKDRARIEDERTRRQQVEKLTGMQEQARVEEDLFRTAMARKKSQDRSQLEHARAMAAAEVARARQLGEAQLELDNVRKVQAIEWERDIGGQRAANEMAIGAARSQDRNDQERYEMESHKRVMQRVTEQKRLAESHNALAAQLTSAGVNRQRQIGYITGELN